MENKGTITWFEIKEKNYPPCISEDKSKGNPSEKVLVWGKGGWPQITYYVHNAKDWFMKDSIPFEITHWAYINYPQ